MTTGRKFRRWEAAVRRQAHDTARALAVTIVAGNAWVPPPYDLGVILEPGETLWHRCPATYHWRAYETWWLQTFCRRRNVTRPLQTAYLCTAGMTDWLITNLRLATRLPDGQVVSIYWSGLDAVSVNLDADLVVLDGPDGYHGELSGPATAPIAVAAIAACHGPHALLDHPAIASLRTPVGRSTRAKSRRRPRLGLASSVGPVLR
jgi:hypothetical protein